MPPRARPRSREVASFTRRTESLSVRNETRLSFARVPFRTHRQLPSFSAADCRKRRGSLSMMVRLPTSPHRGPHLALARHLQTRSGSARFTVGCREAARGKDIDALPLVPCKELDIAWKREIEAILWVDRVRSPHAADTFVVPRSAPERRTRRSQDRSYSRRFA